MTASCSSRGAAFRDCIASGYELRPDEEELLRQAATMIDQLDALDAIVKKDGYVVTDARGRPAMHPAVTEGRQLRAVLRASLKQLRIPDADGVDDVTRQARANGARPKRRAA